MAGGALHFSAAVAARSVAPMAYANPFNGGLISWVGDPANSWDIVSYAVVLVILCSATWLINGAMTFFETRGKVAALSVAMAVSMAVVLIQGNKFDPLDWRQTTTAIMFALAYLSACGWFFSRTEEERKEKSK